MSDIVGVLQKIAPNMKDNYLQAFQDGAGLLEEFGLTTPLRIAHFLAQALHETGEGTVLFENLGYSTEKRLLEIFGVGRHSAAIRPDEVAGLLKNPQALAERVYGLGNPRKAAELGNTRPGDGYRYRGGGLLQTTGGGNYQRMGRKSDVDFHANPELVIDPRHALKPALHEWDEGKLNQAADLNDIRTITRRINGGYIGLAQRQERFDKVWALIGDGGGEAWTVADADDATRWLQGALNALGAAPALTVDGRYGPATATAVRWYQELAHLKVDGVAGDVTRASIKLRLATLRAG